LIIYIWRYTIFASLAWHDTYKPFASYISLFLKFMLCFLFLLLIFIGLLNKNKYYLFGLIFIIPFYLSSTITAEDTLLWSMVLVIFSKATIFDRVIKVYYKHMLLCLGFIITCYFCNITYDVMKNISYASGNSLGTGHSNVIAALLLNLSLLHTYNYLKEKSSIAVLYILAVAGVVWKITNSRTSTILLVSFAIMLVIYNITLKSHTQIILNALKILIIIVIIGSVYLMINNGQFHYIRDTSFSVRFSQANIILQQYGVNLFGSKIEFISTIEASKLGIVALILDNAYLRLFLYYGIVPTILFVAVIIRVLKNTTKRKDYLFLIMITVFIIGGFMEKYILLLNMNFTLLGFLNFGTTNESSQEHVL